MSNKEKKRPKLTRKQEAFCQEYIIDFNATQAAIRAGYSKKTAGSIGFENLKKPEIQKRLAGLIKKRSERAEITADRVLAECMRVALADVGEAFDENGNIKAIHDIPEDVRRAISGFEVIEEFQGEGKDKEFVGYLKKVKFWSKDKNIEVLFRHIGMFEKDNRQKPTNKIIVEYVEPKKRK